MTRIIDAVPFPQHYGLSPMTQDARKAKCTVYRFLCELRNPSPEPFAVMEIESDGLPATVVSLHMMREDAEKAVFGFNEGPLS